MPVVPPSGTITTILPFMAVSSVGSDMQGAVNDITKYVNWK